MVSSGIAATDKLTAGVNANTSVKSKTTSKQDFDSFLQSERLDNSEVRSGALDNTNEDIRSQKNDTVSKDFDKEKSIPNTSEKSSIEQTDDNWKTDLTEEEEVSEETIQAAVILFADILQLIADATGKTVDEISITMQDLGMENMDLLDNGNINELVTELMGKDDIMELLTDTDMSYTVKNLIGEINELKNQFMDSFNQNPETVQSLLNEMDVQDLNHLQNDELETTLPLEMEPAQSDGENLDDLEISDMKSDNQNQVTNESEGEQNVLNEGIQESAEQSGNSDANQNDVMNGKNQNLKDDTQTDKDVAKHGTTMVSDVFDNIRTIVTEALPEDTTESTTNRIVSQIIDDIRLNARPDMTSLEMQLEPENLGTVTISVMAKAGHITAEIAAQNELAKEAIESQLNILKENLNQQGVKVEAIEVTIASHSFEENLEKGNNSSNKQKENKSRKTISAEELAEINGEIPITQDELEEKIMEQMGTTVSYLA